nr:uncharacterized protein LOC123759506 [Procambarus clarkii]
MNKTLPAVFDDLSELSSHESVVETDIDEVSECIATETAEEDFDSDGGEESEVETASRAKQGTGARARPKHTTRTPTPTDSGEGWCSDNTPTFVDSFTGIPGLNVPVPSTLLGFIQLFLTQSLLKYMTYETNLYASQSNARTGTNTNKRWEPMTVKDMARYLGLMILMGTVFARCQELECTGKQKNLSLDEGTMAWRGRLSFKTYNSNKPDKYGMKLYMLAESKTGYIFDFEIYAGIGKTTIETVMGLIELLKNKRYHLYMDNYYNSVRLSELLFEVGIYTCGTIRMQRGAPKTLQIRAKGKLPVDTTVFERRDNTFIILWKDKRVVSLITTCHNADTQQVERRKRVRNHDGTSSVKQFDPKLRQAQVSHEMQISLSKLA